jgi:hypothetical protein
MEIRFKSTGQVMYESELRSYLAANNGPSYDQLTPEVMEAIGVEAVLEGPQATGDHYQYSQRDGVEQIDGAWYTKYILGPLFTDGETTAAEQETAYKAQKDAEQAASVRNSRNDKLKECDWTQIADSTADKALWATYRQALRDVTKQPGFPWTIDWPVAP